MSYSPAKTPCLCQEAEIKATEMRSRQKARASMCTHMSVCSYWVLELSEGVSLTWGGPGWGAWTSQHGPPAQPPAQPGSIWVASGRSAAEPAVAELGQDLFLFPCPACSLRAVPHSIWATTWAVHSPVCAGVGRQESVCTLTYEALVELSLSAWRDSLCTAGPSRNRVDLQDSWGPAPAHTRLPPHPVWTW